MEAFFGWLEGIYVSEKSALGRTRNYALGQKDYVLNIYKDGRLELTNNVRRGALNHLLLTGKIPLCQHT